LIRKLFCPRLKGHRKKAKKDTGDKQASILRYFLCYTPRYLCYFNAQMKTKPTRSPSASKPWRVMAPAGFDGQQKRRAYYFRTATEANEFCTRINRWKANKVAVSDANIVFDEAELQWLAFLKRELRDLSVVPEVVRHWKLTGSGSVRPSSVADAVASYLGYRSANTENKRTLNDICWRLNEFGRTFEERQMHEVSSSEITQYLETKTDGWARKSQYKRLTQFLDWCKERKMISINPCGDIKPPKVSFLQPEIYTVENVAALLEESDKNCKPIFSYIALSGFGFLRQAELVREYANQSVLDWSDIEWNKRTIKVRAEVAKNTGRKTGDHRYITMSDGLIEFLRPYAEKSGPVVKSYHRKFYQLFNECHEHADVELVPNGLRHSCLSYFIAAHPEIGVAQAAIMAGNSESVARRHYIKSLHKEEGEKYWGLKRG
jgi:integrase